MANKKQVGIKDILNPDKIFLFLFLALFPFGQIIRFGVVHPIDIVVGMGGLYAVFKKLPKPAIFLNLINFLIIAVFSWIVSLGIFGITDSAYGLLYLLRLCGYIYFFIYVSNALKNEKANITDVLLVLTVISAALGWVQYFVFPDLKPLFIWNWDMHLYRLAGTFLEPAYLGIIVLLGILISIHKYFESKNKMYIYAFIFLVVSLSFTYSRASYLAMGFSLFGIALLKNKLKAVLIILIIFFGTLFLLPTARNQSIELFRSFSVVARFENYKTTLKIFTTSPVTGIGFNNMCSAYRKYIGFQTYESHACSGSDSSLLFILATTGITGLIIFLSNVIELVKNLVISKKGKFVIVCFVAIFIHSLFSNSLFYPWVMGFTIILLADVLN